jgi:glutathione S-transferase
MRLVTIGISHYCEKARWALDRAALACDEDACAPVLHVPSVWAAGGRRSTPVLVDGDRVIADSTDILDHVHTHPRARWRPWPSGPGEDEARRWEARFDDELGPHVRRLVYHHLLDDRALTTRVVAARTPARQARWFGWLFPVLAPLMRRSMRIDEQGAERSRDRVEALLADVDAVLGDGRRYLVGDAFTGADLTLAALLAPAILHPTYLRIDPATLPAPLRAWTEATRARPAGRLAWRLYETER